MSNRYEIREQIGKGGLGAVYKALDTQLQREVAIKRVLSPDQATEEEVQAAANNLMAEAQTLSSLNHPNIITVFDVGQDEQGGFVVMELLKGETLDDTIERGVLTQEDFGEVVIQSLEALIAAQANDVIHRDIKPTNIMVIWQASGKFQIKILDFGLAKFSKSPSVQTMDQEDSVLGSIFFMAPEQFERGELDARTDLYQMGCVYYNALTSQYPFNGETAPQVMNAHLQHKVVPLEQIRPDLAPSICQWVMWLINRDIEHRPVDARDALKRWPRNPEPTGAVAVQALPVEETPDVTTGQITIVTAASQAYAPPALIVSGTSPNSPVGGRPGIRRSQPEPISGKTKLIIAGSVLAIVLVFAGINIAGSLGKKKDQARITQLAATELIVGKAEDVSIAVSILSDSKATTELTNSALKVLGRLEGSGVDERILEEFKGAQSSTIRIRLARALGDRGYAPALPSIVAALGSASLDDQKIQFLNAARSLAEPEDLDEILSLLQQNNSLGLRKNIEGTAITLLRNSKNPDAAIDSILTRVSTTSGDERKSLFRILGAMGTDRVKTRMSSIYKQKDDPEYQRDAMMAYLSWKDRSVIPDVESIIVNTKDNLLSSIAQSALARLVTLPGADPIEAKVEIWDRAAHLITNPSDVRRIVGTLIENPHQKTLALMRAWAKDEDLKNIAKGSVSTMEKAIAAVKTIAPNEELMGNKARVQGDKKASFNSKLGSITKWTSPVTWFSWSFKVKQPGNYSIEIDQSSLSETPSNIEVHLGGEMFKGETKKTPSLESFKSIRLDGSVDLKPEMIYTLILKAGDDVQPDIMDVAAVRLVK